MKSEKDQTFVQASHHQRTCTPDADADCSSSAYQIISSVPLQFSFFSHLLYTVFIFILQRFITEDRELKIKIEEITSPTSVNLDDDEDFAR
ncbi:unnamed protein product [Vicia faba]|uniref:Uncharacterized protein n=1 Tax=Vicia faba TaxID=3906 RepID=A0AAV1BER7_VICFA|nr:unnamed protein product [Vicia faba]